MQLKVEIEGEGKVNVMEAFKQSKMRPRAILRGLEPQEHPHDDEHELDTFQMTYLMVTCVLVRVSPR
jgi:hypothetical protein